jgi:hypothetical protein
LRQAESSVTVLKGKETMPAEPAMKPPDRTERGRFAPGHSIPGPGSPFSKQVNAYRRAIFSATSETHVKLAWQTLFELAVGFDTTDPEKNLNLKRRIKPDVAALKIFLQYTAGNPERLADNSESLRESVRMTIDEAVAELERGNTVLERAKILQLVKGEPAKAEESKTG